MADAQGKKLTKDAISFVALVGIINQQKKHDIIKSMKKTAVANDATYESAYNKAVERYHTLAGSSYAQIVIDHKMRYQHLRKIALAFDLPEVITKIDDRMGKLFLSPDTMYYKEEQHVKLTIENSKYNIDSLSNHDMQRLGSFVNKCSNNSSVNYRDIVYSPKLLGDFHRNVKRSLYRKSYYHFYVWAFKIKHNPGEFKDNWHIKKICDILQSRVHGIINMVQNPKHLLINLPPRGSKSLICNMYLNLWSWLQNKNMKFVAIAHGNLIIQSQNEDAYSLMKDPKLLDVFPELKMSSNRGKKAHFGPDDGEGARWGVPIGGQLTGIGGNILVADDPLSATNATSVVEREKVNHVFTRTLTSRTKDPNTFVKIVVMQRLHEDDLSGHLLAQKGFKNHWDFIKLPVHAESENDVYPKEWFKYYKNGRFWPEYLTDKTIAEFKSSLGIDFYGQYMQDPVPAEGNIILHAWMKPVNKDKLDEMTKGLPTHFVVDLSVGKKDPTGCIAYQLTKGGIFIVRDAWCEKLTNPEAYKKLEDYVAKVGDHRSMVDIEFDNIGQIFMQWLDAEKARGNVSFNYRGIDAPGRRDSKPQRLSSVSSTFSRSQVLFQEEGLWYPEMHRQLTSAPNIKHDEYVDCVAWMILLNKPTEILFASSMIEDVDYDEVDKVEGGASGVAGGGDPSPDTPDYEETKASVLKRLMPPHTEF